MNQTYALIPAHNEVLTVSQVVEETACHVERVIVIDDGSTDGTVASLAGTSAVVLQHDENIGKGERLVEGFEAAKREGAHSVIVLDADRQHDPNDVPKFLAQHNIEPDAIILGDRSADMKNMPSSRRNGIKFGNFFIGWACCQPMKDAQCGMRLYPLRSLEKLNIPRRHTRRFKYETAVLMYAAEEGISFRYVPVQARYEGFVLRPSHFNPVRDFTRLFGLVTEFLILRGLRPRGFLIALGLINQSNNERNYQ
jgi:glycosyltransferase involved in cell wall biosynthesis